MNDQTTTLAQLKILANEFVKERDWQQFHTPKNLSMNLVREATELMEKFLWLSTGDKHELSADQHQEVAHEVADVLLSVLLFAQSYDIDLSSAFEQKLLLAKQKYPVDKVRGRSDKYTAYMADKSSAKKL